ncbi:MAG: hypothetical protein RMJ59_04200 [Candidatus Nitrosocaldus sp.]|nr:hypothetical protein [Candidatus Nitrosocaldus sp.]MDW8275568.1 hypothetical protein [Candidatus Nitrosocaldus sp.]
MERIGKSLLLRLIPHMDGLTSIDELSSLAGISRMVCSAMVDALIENGIGRMMEGGYGVRFTARDRISAVTLALRLGSGMDEVSRVLDWRDFEMIAAEMLEENGYRTMRNLRLTSGKGSGKVAGSGMGSSRSRVEIDVVGVKKYVDGKGTALLLDCKHWQYMSPSELARICERQTYRAVRFMDERGHDLDVDHAVPVIVVLNDTPSMIDGVPIVPIARLRGFLNELYSMDNLRVVRLDER